jgi:serine/threonine protein kinase
MIYKLKSTFLRNIFFIPLKKMQIIKLLGKGAFGKVYLVKINGSSYALKVIDRENIMIDELNVLKYIQKKYPKCNDYTVCLYDIREDANRFYILQELMDFDLLTYFKEYLSDEPICKKVEILYDILLQIVASIEFIHKLGIIHRDIKPENILVRLDKNGKPHVKLGDFGLGCIQRCKGKEIAGTPLYFAPCYLINKVYKPLYDYYSLGVLVYEILAYIYRLEPFIETETFQMALKNTNQVLPIYQKNYSKKIKLLEKKIDDRCPLNRKLIDWIKLSTRPKC